jgi:hypothetical protein
MIDRRLNHSTHLKVFGDETHDSLQTKQQRVNTLQKCVMQLSGNPLTFSQTLGDQVKSGHT